MDAGGCSGVAAKKPTFTPKAIIYQRFGNKACYEVEEVHESAQNGCPGLAIPQKGPCLYRCRLQLPEFSVVSEILKKKKDAEQSAAEMALEKLGIRPATYTPTVQEAWDDLAARITYLFSNEFISSLHPLSGHFRAALQRGGNLSGLVPVSVIAVCDAKLVNICKSINPKVESNPLLVIDFIMRAAPRLSGSISTSEGKLWIQRKFPYPPEIIELSVAEQSVSSESIGIEAILIPCSLERTVEVVTLNVTSCNYYLDVVAQKLCLPDASKVLLTRILGKASSETRLYFSAPMSYPLDPLSDSVNFEGNLHLEGSLNERASYLSSQTIYGDAVLASIGYTWKSKDLFYENVSLRSYYRMLMSKIPSGIYKLSREAILTVELPSAFTTKTNWRGSFPREILCMFCRQYRLSEPLFSTISIPLKPLSELSESHKKLKVTKSAEKEAEYTNGCSVAVDDMESIESGSTFRCEVKIFSKCQDLIIECSPKDSYKKQSDSIQHASLKVLSWINAYFRDQDMPLEGLNSSADVLEIRFYPQHFYKEFAMCRSVHNGDIRGGKVLESNMVYMLDTLPGCEVCSIHIEGPDTGVCPSNGSLIGINYSVSLVPEGEHTKELLESSEEFEFEIGTGALIPNLETVLTQMSVGQSAILRTQSPRRDLLLAAVDDSARILSLLSSTCFLEYSITLLQVTEPLEDRMEKAFFSPPLSKQRVEYALQHIKESSAATLVDFGCGSGSLLDSLLNYQTSLEKIVGVDISQKSLSRAAKMLHSKLSTESHTDRPCLLIKSATLYDGSITVFDSRLFGFDIGTCLEVIEHMEEDQATLFGNIVLSSFRPKILIVSTPNYEYNVILQKSTLPSQEEDLDETNQAQSIKFRNHDHKFEWTRDQFNCWATVLAARHNYSVEFSGVGGSANMEPGFASQIAIFRREFLPPSDNLPNDIDLEHHYKVIWEWNSCNK